MQFSISKPYVSKHFTDKEVAHIAAGGIISGRRGKYLTAHAFGVTQEHAGCQTCRAKIEQKQIELSMQTQHDGVFYLNVMIIFVASVLVGALLTELIP